MREQGKKLMQMIGFCVKGLDALDQLVPAVQNLGKRHAGYGVTDAPLRHRRRRAALDAGEGPGRGVHARREVRLDDRLRAARVDDEVRRAARQLEKEAHPQLRPVVVRAWMFAGAGREGEGAVAEDLLGVLVRDAACTAGVSAAYRVGVDVLLPVEKRRRGCSRGSGW
jgi:hypothetical protein